MSLQRSLSLAVAAVFLGTATLAAGLPPVQKRKGWFGIGLKAATPVEQKAIGVQRPAPKVTRVFRGSPAETSGVAVGDFVLTLEGKDIANVRDLIQRVGAKAPGSEVEFELYRPSEKRKVTLRVVLDLRPDMRALFRNEWLGKKMPDVSVHDVKQGAMIDLSPAANRGKVLVIDYFATWCGPCLRTMPSLHKLQETYGRKGLTVIGVSTEEVSVLRRFNANFPVNYAIAADTTHDFHKAMMVSVLPTVWIVDRNGVIRDIFMGAGHEAELEAEIRKALGLDDKPSP